MTPSSARVARDDQIFRTTRIVAAIVVPILVLAFVILFLFPATTGERFAWRIQPAMTAAFMGAGYLGGAWLFFNVIVGKRWHHVAPGFPAVSAFTIAMLLVTGLHWDRFNPGHFPFLLWLALYIVTPVLIPALWLRNRVTDPGTPDPDDIVVPAAARWGLGLLGLFLLATAIYGLIRPEWRIASWPWRLTPLTARVLSGWFMILGVGGVVISLEARWSGWRVGLQSIGLWHLLVLVGAVLYRADFPGGLANSYLASVVVVLCGMLWLYLRMEGQRRRLRR